MILSSIIGSAFVKSILGFLSPVFKVVGAVFSTVVKALQGIKIKTDGLVVALVVIGCLIGGWVITGSAREAGRKIERDAMQAAQRKIKDQLSIYVRVQRGEISEDKVRLDLLGDDIKRILANMPKEVQVQTETKLVPVPGETIQVPVFMNFGKAPAKSAPVSTPRGPFQPDYPSELHDAISKINLRNK